MLHDRRFKLISTKALTVAFGLPVAFVAAGLDVADPLIGLLITLVILKITWDSWRVVRHAPAND